MQLLLIAFFYGLFSAVSFPVGALLGNLLSPVRKDVGASFVAFGAGALLFAVTVEIYGHILADFHQGKSGSTLMWCTIAATFVGAASYLYLNRWMALAIESHGQDTVGDQVGDNKSEKVETNGVCDSQGGSSLQDKVPAGFQLAQPNLDTSSSGQQLTSKAGSPTSSACSRKRPRTISVETMQGVPVVSRLSLAKLNLDLDTESQFARMEGRRARLSDMCTEVEVLINGGAVQKTYSTIAEEPERVAGKSEKEQKDGLKLAMALFLGLTVDGIPEAALLGCLVAEGYLSYVLVLSIFLANFPEAFSSASLMTEAGIARSVILGMWTGLCLLTGLLCMAACGVLVYCIGADPDHTSFELEVGIASVEGLAAGSMICCISAVMLPEAYERQNKDYLLLSSGFLCAAGFLSAVALKVLEAELYGHASSEYTPSLWVRGSPM